MSTCSGGRRPARSWTQVTTNAGKGSRASSTSESKSSLLKQKWMILVEFADPPIGPSVMHTFKDSDNLYFEDIFALKL